MPTAILYIRVSTGAQAARGYSQRSQLDRLEKYCRDNNVKIYDTVYEDCSAKSFNRPEWKKLFSLLKTKKTGVDMLLFTSWDRFSRSIIDSYTMIEKLKALGVSVQTVDHPVDFNTVESKYRLAIHFAESEAENARLSERVKRGILKAKQEGKWIGKAPLGYQNRQTSNGMKYIALKEPEAKLLKKAFEEVAKNIFSVGDVYSQIVSEGLQCSRSNFFRLLKNPIYCGKIRISESDTGREYDIDGVHEPLISSVLFEKVQEVIEMRQRKTSKRKIICEELILRGFLSCPECGKSLTGSASKGRSKKYHYYHCHPGCHFRRRADEVNLQCVEFLKKLKANEPYAALVGMIQENIKTASDLKNEAERAQKASMVERFSDKMVNAHDLFVKGDIDYDDYLLIQSNCKRQIKTCVEEVQQLAVLSKTVPFQEVSCILDKLYDFYKEASIEVKREFISYILPEKTTLLEGGFDEMINEPTRIVFNIKSSNPKQGDEDNGAGSFQVMDEKYLAFIEDYFTEKKMAQPANVKNIVIFLKKITLLIIRG
ncbi:MULTISPECIES: recombinase family protein [unclassified Flavobacterium]|uniref:recombinase family protein n=1 Tax=unclassified Flavobacterium TaxID=196869 RepID=UPI00086E23BD|nr:MULTISPECIES: recombinase family protein [unclassified Flavobacterium]MBN9285302.1 recombinase family protein [Flavobacterium sp.]ODT54765.1 MAG: hypothetical protein ABS68_00945 [Niastella sp. SCN 39-18]OJV71983.1 MAG: hypothetical protein BGO42_01050 [Flavobacterium sp. 40-81]